MIDVIDLFSGCGGFSEGFKQAGFNIIYANDNWDKALKSHSLNHTRCEHILADIRTLDDFPEANIVIGSPPCQNFSQANSKKDNLIALETVNEFERVVKIVNPDYWVWENVPQIKQYYPQAFTLDAFDYGLPQHRKRCFVSNFSYIRTKIKKGIITKPYLYDGGSMANFSISKSLRRHKTCSGTVTTKRIRDCETNQYLSIEQVKGLMGFPIDYKLFGGISHQQKQLGNAVCPPVAKEIAEAIKELL